MLPTSRCSLMSYNPNHPSITLNLNDGLFMRFKITSAEAARLVSYPNDGFYLVFTQIGDDRPEIAGGEWIGMKEDRTEADFRSTRLRDSYPGTTAHYGHVSNGTMTLVEAIYPTT